MCEIYDATTDTLFEENFERRNFVSVKVQVAPHHKQTPGLRVYLPAKEDDGLVFKIEEVCSIEIMNTTARLQMKNEPPNVRDGGKSIKFKNVQEVESFVSCMAGYYRLMSNWFFDLSKDLYSPSLKTLKELKCHGPVGGNYSYSKLERFSNQPGRYILRQCENNFNTMYIDIITKTGPETIKILHHNNKFILNKNDGTTETFEDLKSLAISIPIPPGLTHERLQQSVFDKPPLLLLCLPPTQFKAAETVKDLSELKNLQPRIIRMENLIVFKSRCRHLLHECMQNQFTIQNFFLLRFR